MKFLLLLDLWPVIITALTYVPPGESSSDAGTQAGVHRLVESLYGLQGERSKLRGELRLLHSQLEQKERDRHSRIQAFQQQVTC